MKALGVALATLLALAAGATTRADPAGAADVRLVGAAPAAKGVAIPTQWCGGTEAVASDRKPDATTGHQIHVVFAFPSDGPDRFAQFASPIASDIAAIDDWWRRQDPTRTARFDTFAFPGCTTQFGQLDITRLQLPNPGAFYGGNNQLELLSNALRDAGLDEPAKKYLMVYDGPVPQTRVCGQSFVAPRIGTAQALAATFLGATVCPNDLGAGAFQASVIVHELLHNLGAVDRQAPNACRDSGHVCDDPADLMFPSSRGQGIDALTLDVGRNDYYGHTGTWFDTRLSPWLSRLDVPDFPLSVTVSGRGAVAADLPGLACPPQCASVWDGGSAVTLTATPAAGAAFRGWGGACTGLGLCRVVLDAARTVTARFADPVRVSVRIAGGAGGTVVSRPAALACPPGCAAVVDGGSRLVLVARPRAGARFVSWSGACRGTRPTCTIAPARNATVTARFRRP